MIKQLPRGHKREVAPPPRDDTPLMTNALLGIDVGFSAKGNTTGLAWRIRDRVGGWEFLGEQKSRPPRGGSLFARRVRRTSPPPRHGDPPARLRSRVLSSTVLEQVPPRPHSSWEGRGPSRRRPRSRIPVRACVGIWTSRLGTRRHFQRTHHRSISQQLIDPACCRSDGYRPSPHDQVLFEPVSSDNGRETCLPCPALPCPHTAQHYPELMLAPDGHFGAAAWDERLTSFYAEGRWFESSRGRQ
jgi:hypothetical protein